MKRISVIWRISFGLASLTTSLLLGASSLGLVPDTQAPLLSGRKALCEAIAIQCCLAAERNDLATIRAITKAMVVRNEDVLSAAVRLKDGRLLIEAGNHQSAWRMHNADSPPQDFVEVPVLEGKRRWGTVEVRFRESAPGMLGSRWMGATVELTLFISGAGFMVYGWFLRRVLKHLDPSAVIPERVRTTLDTLAEGVLVLDADERIVLANKAFARLTGCEPEDLQGSVAPRIAFAMPADSQDDSFPWVRSIREGISQVGVLIGMDSHAHGVRTLAVNSSPILGADGHRRGALATFDDITTVEQKNVQLEGMLEVLQQSREEIRRQNEELSLLATRDSLTGCVNRRAFFNQFEMQWHRAKDNHLPLSCLMVDIDHFKLINDQHGHATGDHVLQQVAATLRSCVRETDLVCRYGGEEFCLFLANAGLDQALGIAETVRQQIAAEPFAGVPVTASIGVSDNTYEADEPRALLEQADQALYAAKHTGRNRVVSWGDMPPDCNEGVESSAGGGGHIEPTVEVAIPFHAVTALMSALAFRDTLTAEHSRRVADLCALTARGLMTARSCYVLEVAALLHDIGKLGVPDAILLKPGPLTEEEWKVMGTHDRIGVEIISAAFSSCELSEIVRTHHAWFCGQARDRALPQGDNIPLGARILTIADAFDAAMVSDRVYRAGRKRDDAFDELRKCAGKQFDPQIVEEFIAAVVASDESRRATGIDVSKQTALRIGLQIERLAEALDSQDFANLAAMSGRLSQTASKEGVVEIAELAADLERSAGAEDCDLIEIVKLTTDLLELCRLTQSSYLAVGDLEELVEA